jgi:hypothetical protein
MQSLEHLSLQSPRTSGPAERDEVVNSLQGGLFQAYASRQMETLRRENDADE